MAQCSAMVLTFAHKLFVEGGARPRMLAVRVFPESAHADSRFDWQTLRIIGMSESALEYALVILMRSEKRSAELETKRGA